MALSVLQSGSTGLGTIASGTATTTNSQGTTNGSDATFTTVGLPSYGGG